MKKHNEHFHQIIFRLLQNSINFQYLDCFLCTLMKLLDSSRLAILILGFSVISGIEILYWLWFKILFHKKDVEERVLIEELKMDNITWLITHIIV